MSDRRPNRLIRATSPYLQQHALNPVDWWEWGEEAFAAARERDAPIFLSIGYSACHWCHVMERESFENEAIAAMLNSRFVSIKVDREERPDLDEIYMTATQLMTRSGGWPMSVFLTPQARPFYAGTYFPPEDRWGRPGFGTLLREIDRAWREQRGQVEQQAEHLVTAIASLTAGATDYAPLTRETVDSAIQALQGGYDSRHGGFGSAPKFPPVHRLELLLRHFRRTGDPRSRSIVSHTLEAMSRGGMYDHVGGGFHRYSVDAEWLVPHFEKMLYDNAQLARVYTLAWEALGVEEFARVARETIDYVLREMTHPEGGFYSSTDADSAGPGGAMEEGAYFVWTPAEVTDVLGPEAGADFCTEYDITERGNFEGRNIPNTRLRPAVTDPALVGKLGEARRRLRAAREERPRPFLDDKVLTAWNGLMIRALAAAGEVFREPEYLCAGERAARFLLTRMRSEGRLLRSYRKGAAGIPAYQEDYAALALALLELAGAARLDDLRAEGIRLLAEMDALFWDPASPGYSFTGSDQPPLIAPSRSFQDGATPSGAALAALALLRAASSERHGPHRQRAAETLSLAADGIAEMPAAYPAMLIAADEYLQRWPEGISVRARVLADACFSRTAVQPGEAFAAAIRLTVGPDFHLAAAGTRLEPRLPDGFTASHVSYPPGELNEDGDLVHRGEIWIGVELLAGDEVPPGRHGLDFELTLPLCGRGICYPPDRLSLETEIEVSRSAGVDCRPEVFQTWIQARKDRA